MNRLRLEYTTGNSRKEGRNMKFGVFFAVLVCCLASGEAQFQEDCAVNQCPGNEQCYNRYYSTASNYACQCTNDNVGYDCSVDVFATSQQTCYGSGCNDGTFISPNWPSNYASTDARVYLIFVPLAIRLTFTFHPNFAVESGDELYIGAGLTFNANSDLNAASDPSKGVNFFRGNSAPSALMLDGTDSAWLFWRTDDVGTDAGFRVTWRATLDTSPPTVDCPRDQSLEVDMGTTSIPFFYEEPTATDDGAVRIISQSHRPGDVFVSGRFTAVFYTFEDAAGNVAPACLFFVYVAEKDMTPPVVVCPGDFTEYVSPGVTSAEVLYDEPTATDNGGPALVLTQSHAPGDTFPFGSTRVSYTFGDRDGNTAPDCIFYVFVTDSLADIIPPDVNCPMDISRPVSQGISFLPVSFPDATATDNSGTASFVSVDPLSGSSFALGTTDVTFSFIDPSDNIGTCTFTITIYVVDTTAPVVTCPPDITRSVLPGVTSLAVTFQSASATDDSGTASLVSVNPPSGSSFPLGPTDVSFVFEDPSGNQGSCTFRITITTSTILDTTPPVVTCPLNFTRLVPRGVSSLRVVFPDATATDDSGRTTLVSVDPPSGSLFPLGPTEITFRFADRSGNVGNCTLCVTITALGPTGCGNTSCENGATCVTVGEDFVCECLPGFVGDRCEIDINECSSLPCLNGGTCTNGVDQFSCLCRQGYSGINCGIVGFCDLEGDWYNECNDRLSLSPTSTGLILGDYYSSIELITGYNNPYLVVGYISRRCDFSSFGLIVTQNNGKSTGSWSGQCHLCDGQEVLYTTWTHRLRVDTCADTRKATRVGQDKWTRYKQDQAPREA